MMPSRITTWKKGRPYLYWGRSAGRNGHSRIVEQRDLGPRDRVLEQIRAQGPASPPPEALPPLHTVQPREFGASALGYSLAQALGLLELIDAQGPPAPPQRRPSLAVGPSLGLAARHRVVWPKSTRAFAAGYQDTGLARRVPASREEWSRQRFWAHRHVFAPEHCAPMQRERLPRRPQRCGLGAPCLVYATPTSSPCIPPCHSRPSLPQRGKNPQKRTDLRPRSLALVVVEERGLPLYERGSEGTVTAVGALRPSLQERRGHFRPPSAAARLPLVLDQGQVSHENVKARLPAPFSFLAALPAGGGRPRYQVALQAYQPRPRPDGRRSTVYGPPNKPLGGIRGQRLVSCSPRL
jgi:hypothetical protein